MAKLHIKKGDIVTVISGSSKYRKLADGTEVGVKKGEVIATSPDEGKVLVKDANIIHKHVKPRRQGETGGIVDAEGAMYASKVALYCPKCDKGVRTHIVMDGDKKVRTCVKCGHKFD
ncbi:MAG: 50S ribosomal protein L24 [Clostridia bacterium]|nr:50S ribosomal protein L24 [Clostridia bacterium]